MNDSYSCEREWSKEERPDKELLELGIWTKHTVWTLLKVNRSPFSTLKQEKIMSGSLRTNLLGSDPQKSVSMTRGTFSKKQVRALICVGLWEPTHPTKDQSISRVSQWELREDCCEEA